MLISEMEAQLKDLREKHGDIPIYATCHKENLFYSPTAEYRMLLNFDGEERCGILICPQIYGCIE